MAQGKASDLNKVGGNTTLTNTVKPHTQTQLDAVAINSGIISGPVSTVNTWPVNSQANDVVQPQSGNDNTTSVSDDSYTTS